MENGVKSKIRKERDKIVKKIRSVIKKDDLFGIVKNFVFRRDKVTKTVVSIGVLMLILNGIIWMISPNEGWLSLDGEEIQLLEINAEYMSALNTGPGLRVEVVPNIGARMWLLADSYRMYDEAGNLVRQSDTQELLRLELDYGVTISSAASEEELIRYRLYAQDEIEFQIKKDKVFLDEGYGEWLDFSGYGTVDIATDEEENIEEWKISSINNDEFSTIYCQGHTYLRFLGCNNILINRNRSEFLPGNQEQWYFERVRDCSAQLRGNIDFKVYSIVSNYEVVLQPLLIEEGNLTCTWETEDNKIKGLKLVGAAKTVELNEESIFPTVFSIIYSNLWGFAAILIAPVINFLLHVWTEEKRE